MCACTGHSLRGLFFFMGCPRGIYIAYFQTYLQRTEFRGCNRFSESLFCQNSPAPLNWLLRRLPPSRGGFVTVSTVSLPAPERRLVVGAERDRIVDEAGVKEMATFLGTDHVMLPTVPHEVRRMSFVLAVFRFLHRSLDCYFFFLVLFLRLACPPTQCTSRRSRRNTGYPPLLKDAAGGGGRACRGRSRSSTVSVHLIE